MIKTTTTETRAVNEQSLADILKTEMQKRSWTTEQQVADETGISRGVIVKILDGSDRFRLRSLQDLFGKLGYKVDLTVTPIEAAAETAGK